MVGAVNTGLAHATGFYFKVVDSDDWLDPAAMFPLMVYLRSQLDAPVPCDMVVANYVYDKVDEGEQKVMGYGNVLPEGYEFGWDEVGTFLPSQYLLMHSVYLPHRDAAQDAILRCPSTRFYVDNIFVYVAFASTCAPCATSTWTPTVTSSGAKTSRSTRRS